MMPAGDQTGPLGRGPMTGRGAGFCVGAGSGVGFGSGRGGRGRGFGRGYGFRAFAEPTREERVEILAAQIAGMEQQLQLLRGEMKELEVSE